jgi:tRNA pseudouridine(55) synthase
MKSVGETPLASLEAYRAAHPEYADLPMAYAGRLDPMASGKLLVLIGEECKRQEHYHGLDKEYVFEVLFGISSDTADVLGLLEGSLPTELTQKTVADAAREFTGEITLPYPHFSSKTVNGKPLHTWTLEGRIGEIQVPRKHSRIHCLEVQDVYERTAAEIYEEATRKIETIPLVTDPRKSLGNDFRRAEIRSSWESFKQSISPDARFTIAKMRAIASSGTYMRSLAEALGRQLGLPALAYSIDRTQIGRYLPLGRSHGIWLKRY